MSTTKHRRGPCRVDGCGNDAHSRGMCGAHYQRWYKYGDPLAQPNRPSPQERFWSKVTKGDGCWEWGGKPATTGYGVITCHGKRVMAHRFAYELLVGPIPEGLVIDHICRNRMCVNPDHLEPVTNRENILRGKGASATAARRTHCPQGHPYDEENTSFRGDGSRRCKTCHRDRERERQRSR